MEISFSQSFKKSFSKKIRNTAFEEEFWLRVVFFFTTDKPPRAVFVDIGTHDEVY